MHILPGRPTGKPDQMSPIRAAVPRFFTVARFDEDVIASDANFTIRDPDGFQFAIMSSSMFITWQKAIGGRLKSDLRFGSTLTWYTLPLPQVGPDERAAIAEAGQGILEARGDCRANR